MVLIGCLHCFVLFVVEGVLGFGFCGFDLFCFCCFDGWLCDWFLDELGGLVVCDLGFVLLLVR